MSRARDVAEEDIHALIRQGYTITETAKKLKIVRSTVYDHLPADYVVRPKTRITKAKQQFIQQASQPINQSTKLQLNNNQASIKNEQDAEDKRIANKLEAIYIPNNPETKPTTNKSKHSPRKRTVTHKGND
jgi:hypothetical protein